MGNIAVIGPRASGKTVFLAGLAYWYKRQQAKNKNSRFNVVAQNDEADRLQKMAVNIIEAGDFPNPSDDIRGYAFAVEVKKRFSSEYETISLVAKDSPGELFHDLANFYSQSLYDSSAKPQADDFWEECFLEDKKGCLILLSDWADDADRHYHLCLNGFLKLMEKWKRKTNFRVAVAISKCERGELWTGRIEPEIDLFDIYLPQSKAILTSELPSENLRFFAMSTFGVMSKTDPRPNREIVPDLIADHAILRSPKKWQPYNLIAPLYWLSTGKKISSHVH
jgi:hypothetical protein